jgi:hypothetical protein
VGERGHRFGVGGEAEGFCENLAKSTGVREEGRRREKGGGRSEMR